MAHLTGEFVIVHKMVAVLCLVWPPTLQLWSGRQAGQAGRPGQAGQAGRPGRQAGQAGR